MKFWNIIFRKIIENILWACCNKLSNIINNRKKSIIFCIGILLTILVVYNYTFQREPEYNLSKIVIIPSMGQVIQKGAVTFYAGHSGHFVIGAKVNGAPVHFLLDTGATKVTLTEKDARRLGINLESLNYNIKVQTAKGIDYVSCLNLKSIQVGDIIVQNVKGCIAKNGLSKSLLGMNFLNRITKYEVSRGRITFWR